MLNYTLKAVLQTQALLDERTSSQVWLTTSAPPFAAANVTESAVSTSSWPVLLVLPWISIWGFIGNLMVCIAIYTDKRLQNITNYFLFSLAVADLLVCALVMPFSIDVEFNLGKWRHGVILCVVYVYADVFLCSASIVHMSVISLDRYLGISRPFKTRNKSLKVVMLKITLVWVVTVLISSPIAVLAHIDKANIMAAGQCLITNRYFMVYGSTLAFLIPFVVMAVTYCKTTALLNQQAALLSIRIDGKQQEGLRRTMKTPRSRASYRGRELSTTSALLTMSPPLAALSSNRGGGDDDSTTLMTLSAANSRKTTTAGGRAAAYKQNGHGALLRSSTTISEMTSPSAAKPPHMMRLQRLKRQTQLVFWQLATKAGRRGSFETASQELVNEHKATRVLAVVFICFFTCWTPFFGNNFTYAFCGNACLVPETLASIFLWLGYISSTVNPVIYTVFNRRFRDAFWNICRCRCCFCCRSASRRRRHGGNTFTSNYYHATTASNGYGLNYSESIRINTTTPTPGGGRTKSRTFIGREPPEKNNNGGGGSGMLGAIDGGGGGRYTRKLTTSSSTCTPPRRRVVAASGKALCGSALGGSRRAIVTRPRQLSLSSSSSDAVPVASSPTARTPKTSVPSRLLMGRYPPPPSSSETEDNEQPSSETELLYISATAATLDAVSCDDDLWASCTSTVKKAAEAAADECSQRMTAEYDNGANACPTDATQAERVSDSLVILANNNTVSSCVLPLSSPEPEPDLTLVGELDGMEVLNIDVSKETFL